MPAEAASPANPTPELNAPGDAAVIPINKRRQARKATTGRWKKMSRADTPPAPPGPADPVRELAESYEKSFNANDLTLTDEDTATAFRVTLRLVSTMLEGARVQGIVTEEQRGKLAELIQFAEDVPGLLA